MFLENYALDQSVTKITNPAKGQTEKAIIIVENMERAAMPLQIEITYENGTKEFHNFPIEIWEQGSVYKFTPDSDGAISKVAIDPKGIFPDRNITNNVWNGKQTSLKSN